MNIGLRNNVKGYSNELLIKMAENSYNSFALRKTCADVLKERGLQNHTDVVLIHTTRFVSATTMGKLGLCNLN